VPVLGVRRYKMKPPVTIATIDEIPIYLKEATEPSKKIELTSFCLLVLGFVVGALGQIVAYPNYGVAFALCAGALGLAMAFLSFLVYVYSLEHGTPSYNVWCKGEFGVIIKTTPEADQIAICKSVNAFKSKLQKQQNERIALEKIAANCK
jgi:hypothetical protein